MPRTDWQFRLTEAMYEDEKTLEAILESTGAFMRGEISGAAHLERLRTIWMMAETSDMARERAEGA